MNLKLIAGLLGAAAIASAGYWGGLQYAGHQEEKRVQACAAGLKENDPTRCPTPILDAFSTLQLRASEQTVVYRDRTIPVIVQGQAAQSALQQQETADITAIASEERTRACADSPAVRRRREQLLRDEGPAAVAGDAPADPSAG